MKARELKALRIDLEGRITLEGELVNVIPIGRPDLVKTDQRMRKEGGFRYGTYGCVEKSVKIPYGADSFVLGTGAAIDYTPIQFYEIVRSNRHKRSTFYKKDKNEREKEALSDVPPEPMIFPIPERDMWGPRNSGEWEHWENAL